MKSANKPILSICIPSYNRAELLRSALISVLPQLAELKGAAEVVVSDNCSTDHTRQVVEWAERFGPVRYHCNPENLGMCRNLVLPPNELANGEYCWVIGDDDMVRPGGVRKLVSVLQQHPEVEYVFTNFAHLDRAELAKHPRPVSSADITEGFIPRSKIFTDHLIDKWERLIDPRISDLYMGSMQGNVFRTSTWRAHSHRLVFGKEFSTITDTYPHAQVLIWSMMGKPAFYIGEPVLFALDGARTWWDSQPMMILAHLTELIDIYEGLGVDPDQIRRCREHNLWLCGQNVVKMLCGPGIEQLKPALLSQFLQRFGGHPVFHRSMLQAMITTYDEKVRVEKEAREISRIES